MKSIACALLVLVVAIAATVTFGDFGSTARPAGVIVVAGNCDPQISRCE